ncbi:hypothetical protein A1O3_02581 [Capronia epimyces CBS 606.96]|uniref:Uncharacterized protein n=1 Tax=Capronia epimyces CBS 606.96 TaxID=1182542 RepID=W9Z4U8_9EURO|nr:uncharacterized protein A1O3_02581 [Capronia epimyces CBS 606.96]EXJ89514.1 hypothetical protein A1O3_02581 [Capronia epimyces CBS 606.96]
MLSGLLDRTWDFRSWHAVRDSFCKAAELGLLSVEDLRAVIAHAADAGPMSLVKDNGKLQIVQSIEKEHLIYGLLTSLANSRVLELADLGRDFLSRLLRKVGNNRRLTSTAQRILWDLSPWASEHDAPLISRLIMIHLRARCRDNPDEEVGQRLAKRLAKVEPKALQLSLLQTTDDLIRIGQEDTTSIYAYLLHHWTGTLALLGSRQAPLLTKDTWVIHSSNASSLSTEQRLAAFAWASLCLGKCRRKSPALSERLQFLDSFGKTLKSIPELATEGFLDRSILAIDSLPLPNKHVLLQNLYRIADRDPLPILLESESSSDIEGFRYRSFSLFLSHNLYENARISHHDVLTVLAESLNHDLPLFKMLSRRMIQKSPLSFEIISRILDNNISFKLALSQAFPQRLLAVQQGAEPSDEAPSQFISFLGEVGGRPACRNNVQTKHSGIPSPVDALDLINHLAVSFATSTVTSPRASLRRVYWCYMFLHRYGGPVQPTIARALWHVGVARYGESGTSRTLLKWILWQVKNTEGEDVARHLLWSQSLREQWQRDLEDLSKVDESEEKHLLAEMATGEDAAPSSHSIGIPASADLETLRKIHFVQTEPEELPFFFEKSRRRADWDQAQAKKAKALERQGK